MKVQATMTDEQSANLQQFARHGFSFAYPFNYDPDTPAAIEPYKDVIEEVYTGLHPELFPSARLWDQTISPENTLKTLEKLFTSLNGWGISLNVILNSVRADLVRPARLFEALERLADIGPLRVTVSDLRLARELRQRFPSLSLEVSTIAQIGNQYQAMLWRDLVDPDVIVIDREINKRLEKIAQIKALGMRIKMVPIDTCIPFCPLRQRHTSLLAEQDGSYAAAAKNDEHLRYCSEIKGKLPLWHWLKREVLPYDLSRYAGVVDIIKLIDRNDSTEDNIELLGLYLKMASRRHPRIGYSEKQGAFDKISHCDLTCDSCGWCASHIELPKRREDVFRLQQPLDAEGRTQKSRDVGIHSADGVRDFDSDVPQPPHPLQPSLNDSPSMSGELTGQSRLGKVIMLGKVLSSEQEITRRRLRLYRNVLEVFKPFLLGQKPMPNGYVLHELTRNSPDSFLLEWRKRDHKLLIGVVGEGWEFPTAFHTGEMGVYLLNESNSPVVEQHFKEMETQLKWLINRQMQSTLSSH